MNNEYFSVVQVLFEQWNNGNHSHVFAVIKDHKHSEYIACGLLERLIEYNATNTHILFSGLLRL